MVLLVSAVPLVSFVSLRYFSIRVLAYIYRDYKIIQWELHEKSRILGIREFFFHIKKLIVIKVFT